MALQSSGAISLTNIQTEFGGVAPISLSEYYAGGAYVRANVAGLYGAIPASGALSFSKYYGSSSVTNTQRAIFGFGYLGPMLELNMTNLVSNTGVVASDTAGVGTGRFGLAAASYGGDKAIFGYGSTNAYYNMTNLVSNTGVVATDTAGVGTARSGLAAAGFSLT
jgi:hypothetical protein